MGGSTAKGCVVIQDGRHLQFCCTQKLEIMKNLTFWEHFNSFHRKKGRFLNFTQNVPRYF